MFLIKVDSNAENNINQASGFVDFILDSNKELNGIKIDYKCYGEEDNKANFVINKDNYTVTDNILTFTARENVNNISEVIISNVIYTLAKDANDLQPQEFYFDFKTKAVEVFLIQQPLGHVGYTSSVESLTIKENCVIAPLEPILLKYSNSAKLKSKFILEKEPTFTLSIEFCEEDLPEISNYFCNGSEHTIDGYKVVVDNPQIVEPGKNSTNLYKININFIHYLASRGDPDKSAMDYPLKLVGQSISPQGGSNGNSYVSRRTLGDFAVRAGINYRGKDLRVRIERDTKPTAYTTFRSLLEERKRNGLGFIHFTQDGVELREWKKTRIHFINESDLIDTNITFSPGGHGTEIDGIKLSNELRNIKVNFDFDKDTSEQNQGFSQDWSLENATSVADLYIPAETGESYTLNPSNNVLRSPGNIFDYNTIKKRGTENLRFNGSIIFQRVIETGYRADSSETHLIDVNDGATKITFNNPNPQSFWKANKEYTKDWIYEGNDGYLKQKIATGTQVARVQKETEELEAALLEAELIQNPGDDNIRNRRDSYKFNLNLPILDVEHVTLNNHRSYFSDTKKQALDDFEPKFVKRKFHYRDDKVVRENPNNTEEITLPPIVTGQFFREIVETNITSSTFPQKFETRTIKQNNEGAYFRESNTESNIAYREGKPSIAPRLNTKLDYSNGTINPNFSIYSGQNLYIHSPQLQDVELKIQEGSKKYIDIDNPEDFLEIAKIEQSIINSQNSFSATINIFWRAGIEVGDFAMFRGKFWKIFSKDDDRSFQGNYKVESDRFALGIGRYFEPELILENRLGAESTIS